MNTGVVQGISKTSYRAEIGGVLPLILFLKSVTGFHALTISKTINYTDSESFKRKYLKSISTVTMSCHNTIFKIPGWDSMTQILHETLQNNATLNLHFVESHQYKHALIHTLPLPVQLNIAANKLAGNRRFKQQSQTLMADLLPTTKIHLYFGASTVTGMYKSLLEQQYQRFVSIKYIS